MRIERFASEVFFGREEKRVEEWGGKGVNGIGRILGLRGVTIMTGVHFRCLAGGRKIFSIVRVIGGRLDAGVYSHFL